MWPGPGSLATAWPRARHHHCDRAAEDECIRCTMRINSCTCSAEKPTVRSAVNVLAVVAPWRSRIAASRKASSRALASGRGRLNPSMRSTARHIPGTSRSEVSASRRARPITITSSEVKSCARAPEAARSSSKQFRLAIAVTVDLITRPMAARVRCSVGPRSANSTRPFPDLPVNTGS